MHKKVLYLAGTGVAVGLAYLKGVAHGQELTESYEGLEGMAESIESEDVREVEEEAGEHVGRVVDATEEELEDTDDSDSEDEDMVECEDEDCTETFETKHGMKVHYGIAHNDDETEDE